MTEPNAAQSIPESFHTWQRSFLAAGWCASLQTEQVPVDEAVGRVTAAPVRARWSSPAHELAAMDGIAVRAADIESATPASPVRLASKAYDVVDTGDPLPPGRDAVVMREHVMLVASGHVDLIEPVRPGRHVRGVGEDVVAGELLLPAGHRLRPVDTAVAAGAGHGVLSVRRAPQVAVLPTGDEVRPVGTEIGRGEIIDTNSVMLAAMAREAGCTAIRLPIVPDDRLALTAAIRAAAEQADLVLVIAGSSAGRDDHTADVLAGLGEVAVHGVAMRPGHPVVLGLARARTPVPVIGVPGYPVSAAHVFDTFALPFLQMLQGTTAHEPPEVRARLARAVTSPVGVDDCLMVRLEPRPGPAGLLALPIGRGAGALSALMRANGLLCIPAGSSGLASGSEVLVHPLPGGPNKDAGAAEAHLVAAVPLTALTQSKAHSAILAGS